MIFIAIAHQKVTKQLSASDQQARYQTNQTLSDSNQAILSDTKKWLNEINSQAKSTPPARLPTTNSTTNITAALDNKLISLNPAHAANKMGKIGRRHEIEDDNATPLHPILYDFYNSTISQSPHVTSENLWDDSKVLPNWMKLYLQWHHIQRAEIMEEHSQTPSVQLFARDSARRFLVIQCRKFDRRCGGTADRLKPLPWFVRVAYYTKRILLFYWEKPGRLEEFLVPPKGGLDWSMRPAWMVDQVSFNVFVGGCEICTSKQTNALG